MVSNNVGRDELKELRRKNRALKDEIWQTASKPTHVSLERTGKYVSNKTQEDYNRSQKWVGVGFETMDGPRYWCQASRLVTIHDQIIELKTGEEKVRRLKELTDKMTLYPGDRVCFLRDSVRVGEDRRFLKYQNVTLIEVVGQRPRSQTVLFKVKFDDGTMGVISSQQFGDEF